MDNQEKEKASKVFNTVWDMTKRYAFIPLDDFRWERFVEEMEQKSQEFKQEDENMWILYRGLMDAVRNYKEKQCERNILDRR